MPLHSAIPHTPYHYATDVYHKKQATAVARQGSLYVPASHVDDVLTLMKGYQTLLKKGIPNVHRMPTEAVEQRAIKHNSAPGLPLPHRNQVALFVANLEAYGQRIQKGIKNGFFQVDLGLHDLSLPETPSGAKNNRSMRMMEHYVEAAVSRQATHQGIPHQYVPQRQPVERIPPRIERWMDAYQAKQATPKPSHIQQT